MEETNIVLQNKLFHYYFIPLINAIPSRYLLQAMYFTAGNQALYVQPPEENSHENLPTPVSPDLNLILLISSPELPK